MDILNSTKELNHVQYFSVVERMYNQNSVEEMKNYAGFSQVERFRKELETLGRFGLHKHLDITLDRSDGEDFAASKYSDGKVDLIYSVSNTSINETYLNQENRKRHRRKIKHAFVISTAIKSNKTLRYDAENPPHCMNCGAPMEAQGDKYHCDYCDTWYVAEAYKYLLTRFFIDPVFKHRRYVFLFFLFLFILGVIPQSGLVDTKQWEKISIVMTMGVSVILVALFFVALGIGLYKLFKEKILLRKIRHHDPHFSKESFTSRANDLLGMHPEIILKENDNGKQGVICRSIQELQLTNYERKGNWEFVEFTGKADVLYLDGSEQTVRLKDQMDKFALRLGRIYGTLTPVHYAPDQFTCQNCGSHEIVEHEGVQVCSYCQTERPLETIDWVIA
ncbi:MAG: hypothetical protein PUJ57_02395 [Peptoniphilaceae bacterium]|nr:hypothetical protein [Peptoniphilaceae bacterium]MDD7593074.1 hypothetical protein [Peptoniphilaceae bacterium]MDY5765879.1 hypothetical protein [Peptoniphilaceae bacterium]